MENFEILLLISGVVSSLLVLGVIKYILSLRRVVPTDEVHILQSTKRTISYGANKEGGNSYYEWPYWIPFIGVSVKRFSVANFEIRLKRYKTYDSGRLPLSMDVSAFFRVDDTNLAAQRVSSQQGLAKQLESIMESVTRTIISKYDVERLLEARSELGDNFTLEIGKSLKEWGVVTTKNVEIADIDDADDSNVIKNITLKKESEISKDSRMAVALNNQHAEMAEIEASREIELKRQDMKKEVGLREVNTEREISISRESSNQQVKEAERITKEREMAVIQVQQTKQAEIDKEVNIIRANESKETSIIRANESKETSIIKAEAAKQTQLLNATATKETAVTVATGELEAKKMQAEGIEVEGKARAASDKALQLAPVEAQITLAKEIGENQSYQTYLIRLEEIKANQIVGMENAKAIGAANIKMIVNSDNVGSGINNIGELFSLKGGSQLGAAVESFLNTEAGKTLFGSSVSKD